MSYANKNTNVAKQRDIELGHVVGLLNNVQIDSKMEGLDLIAKVLKFQNPSKLPEGESLPAYKVPVLYSRSHISNYLPQVFSGFETCLTLSELEVDLLMKVNQVLYDMMPDIARYPNDLQPEVARLIPALIMNLGNSKVRANTNSAGHRSQVHSQVHRHLRQVFKKARARNQLITAPRFKEQKPENAPTLDACGSRPYFTQAYRG